MIGKSREIESMLVGKLLKTHHKGTLPNVYLRRRSNIHNSREREREGEKERSRYIINVKAL